MLFRSVYLRSIKYRIDQVLRNIFGPVNLGPKKHRAAVPLHRARRAAGDDNSAPIDLRHDEYDFLAFNVSRSSAKVPHFGDLPSLDVSNMVQNGLILWKKVDLEAKKVDFSPSLSSGQPEPMASEEKTLEESVVEEML